MIEVTNLAKNYGEYQAVKNISFSARKGEILGFLGPNGAGKTTTIRILSTYMPPSSGSAKVEGYDITTQPSEVRKRIGYLPETPPLYGEMTVAEYLKFIAEIKGIQTKSISEKVDVTLERCFLKDMRKKLCQHLSKGYRQRVGIAQAIIHEPPVIILDEPTSGLDPKQIIEIRNLIKSLGQNHTVIISTHILPEVSMVCNKVVIVNKGRVILEDSLENIVKDKSLEQVFLECVSQDAEAVAL